MYRTTKSIAARAAACFLFFATAAGAQSLRLAHIFHVAARQSISEPEIFRCAFETENPFAPERLKSAAVACEALVPPGSLAQSCRDGNRLGENCDSADDAVKSELSAMGKRGEIIARARANVLEILQDDNACSAWFRELDVDPAGTFRSAHFVIQENGPRYVSSLRKGQGEVLKHPWVASTVENAGRNATIWVNANGAFFNAFSEVITQDLDGGPVRPVGMRALRVNQYPGNTTEAQVTTLLHELGHIVGRLPEDSDSIDGESGRNTVEVLRNCWPEVRAVADRTHRGAR